MAVEFVQVLPPDGETFTAQLAQRLEPWLTADLQTYLGAVALMFAQVEELAYDQETDDDWFEGWTLIFDPVRAPGYALPFVAQLKGERLAAGLSEDDQRRWIQDAPNQIRGTNPAILTAAQKHLTGQRHVSLVERYLGVVDQVSIRTLTSETPNSTQTRLDILGALPADVILDYGTVTGVTWDEVKAMGTWDTVHSQTWDDLITP